MMSKWSKIAYLRKKIVKTYVISYFPSCVRTKCMVPLSFDSKNHSNIILKIFATILLKIDKNDKKNHQKYQKMNKLCLQCKGAHFEKLL